MTDLVDTKHALLLDSAGGEQPAAALVMALLSTVRRIDAACASLLAQHGLTEGRFAVLLAISAQPGATPAELAERVGVRRATITGLLDGLAAAGFATRQSDAADRRSVRLRATPAGEALIATLRPQYAEWLADLTRDVGDSDAAALTHALAAIQRTLSAAAR